MSASVLFDAPGPKARRRILLVSLIAVVALLALAGYILWRLAEAGQFSAKRWSVFTLPAAWDLLFNGWLATIRAFALAAVGSIVLGLLLSFGRLSSRRWIRVPVGWVTEVFRAIPVLIFMMLMYYGLPILGVRVSTYLAVVIALVLYNGSVLAEVFRAGMESVPRGQSEAAYAIGLRKSQVIRMILLPQAVRAMLPVIIAQLVVALKDTALGYLITYEELLYAIRQFYRLPKFDSPIIPATIVGGSIYILTCLVLSGVAVYVNKRVSRTKTSSITIKG